MPEPGSNFDQRPGELEATREALWPLVYLTHDPDEGWQISIINGSSAVRLSGVELLRLQERLQDALDAIEKAER